mmetsp:Transcript_73260/g.188978  ORF Transcript_73260/g.188978 Transcript_73260/m.188978 type:complete len:206 (+) Transcript_73260:445-1062(+)
MLAAVKELALVLGTVCPALDAFSALLILRPLTVVGAAVLVDVLAVPVGAVLVPLALVDVAVGGDEGAVAVGPAVDEGALVRGAVRPAENAVAVALVALPLALVLRSGLHLRLGTLLQLITGEVIVLLADSGLLIVEVAGANGVGVHRLIWVALAGAALAASEQPHWLRRRRAVYIGCIRHGSQQQGRAAGVVRTPCGPAESSTLS